jgi:ubiquinone/menaquinone biosynthesis C-methylase UbiE
MPTPDTLDDQVRERARTYEALSPTYDLERFSNRWGRYDLDESRALVKDLLTRLLPRTDWSALDVATGTGKVAVAVAELGGKVTALDAAEGMLARCRELAKDWGVQERMHFTKATATAMPFPDNTFDVVLSFRFLHLFPTTEYSVFLREMARVTKPGGFVIVEVKNRWYCGVMYHWRDLIRRLQGKTNFSSYVSPRQFGTMIKTSTPLSLVSYSGLLLPRAWWFAVLSPWRLAAQKLARGQLKWIAGYFVLVYRKTQLQNTADIVR